VTAALRATELSASPTPSVDALRERLADLVGRALGAAIVEKISESALAELHELLGEPVPQPEHDHAVGIDYLAKLLPGIGRARLYEIGARIPGRLDLEARKLVWPRRAIDEWFSRGGGDLLPARRRRSRSAQPRGAV
jgi:hypothetical protein